MSYIRSAPSKSSVTSLRSSRHGVEFEEVTDDMTSLALVDRSTVADNNVRLLADLQKALSYWQGAIPEVQDQVKLRKNGKKLDQFDWEYQTDLYKRMLPVITELGQQQHAIRLLIDQFDQINLTWNRFLDLKDKVNAQQQEAFLKKTGTKVGRFTQFIKGADEDDDADAVETRQYRRARNPEDW